MTGGTPEQIARAITRNRDRAETKQTLEMATKLLVDADCILTAYMTDEMVGGFEDIPDIDEAHGLTTEAIAAIEQHMELDKLLE
jgi:hypothetical protein